MFGNVKSIKNELKDLYKWVENISTIQNQLLKELGYEIKWNYPYPKERVYIVKKEEKIND